LLGNLVAAAIFLVGRLDFSFVGSDFGLEIFGLDEGVVQLNLFILVFELVLQLGGADADAICDELAKLVLEQALPNEFFEYRDSQLEAGLDLGGVAVHANECVAVVGGGKKLADAVGALLVGNADAQALGFVFHFFLEDELVENLARVQGLQLLGNLVALLNFRELLAHFGGADGFVANFGDNVCGGSFAGAGRLRHEIEEHAAAEEQDDSS